MYYEVCITLLCTEYCCTIECTARKKSQTAVLVAFQRGAQDYVLASILLAAGDV